MESLAKVGEDKEDELAERGALGRAPLCDMKSIIESGRVLQLKVLQIVFSHDDSYGYNSTREVGFRWKS